MAVMTSRGRVTLPAKIRAGLGVGAGDKIEFVKLEGNQFVIVAATKLAKKLKGLARSPEKRSR